MEVITALCLTMRFGYEAKLLINLWSGRFTQISGI